MSPRAPGDLTASRLAVLPDGDVAEAVITERTAAYAVTLRECYARWFSDGAWSAWRLVTENALDVSIAADTSREEDAALVGVLIWVPLPAGGIAASHAAHQTAYFRLSPGGVVSVDL